MVQVWKGLIAELDGRVILVIFLICLQLIDLLSGISQLGEGFVKLAKALLARKVA